MSLSACAGDDNVFPDGSVSGNGQPSAGALDPSATGYILSVLDYDMTQYASIGDYLNMDLAYQKVELSDEEKASEYVGFLAEFANEVTDAENITDRPVEFGDVVCLDYCGKQDGVPFEGGTGTGYLLGIGSNTFIPGFEDGLIGWMPGEEKDLPITFPEEYHSAELAGQEVVFTCTVQYIVSPDAILAEANKHLEEGEEAFTNMEDFEKYYYEELQRQVDDYNKSTVKNRFYDQLPGLVTINQPLPAELVASYNTQIQRAIEAIANSYGVDAETYAAYMGQPLDEYVTGYAEQQLNYDIALYLIAAENNCFPTDEEFNAWISGMKADSGLSDEEFFMGASEAEYRVYYFEEQVADFLVEKYFN